MLGVQDYLLKLEMDLMVGGGRWVADFSESFWDYPISSVPFKLVLTGGMRGRGFLISRVVNWFFIPNYQVACLAYTTERNLTHLYSILEAVEQFRKDKDLAWCWLVIPKESSFSRRDKLVVEQNDTRELGIALVDLSSETITTNASYIGRRMARFVRCFR